MNKKQNISEKDQMFLQEMSSVEEEKVQGGLKMALKEYENDYGIIAENINRPEDSLLPSGPIDKEEIPAWRISF